MTILTSGEIHDGTTASSSSKTTPSATRRRAVRIHRMIRRGTSYGPPLPDGLFEDDGVDRGLMFAFIGAHLGRQFEFVQSEWMNDAAFLGGSREKDPVP